MILLIDNYDSFTYNLYQDIAQKTDEVLVVRNDKITLDEIAKLKPAGIVLSPGPGRPEDAGICVDLIKRFSGSIPILGICLGHQAIAIAFNSQVVQAENIMHGKTSPAFHNRQVIFKNIALPFEAGRYHSLVIDRDTLSPELEVTAESADDIIMAVQHKTHPTYGLQFHPESILTESGSDFISNFLEAIKQEKVETA
jgi:anthranilate synthase component 2